MSGSGGSGPDAAAEAADADGREAGEALHAGGLGGAINEKRLVGSPSGGSARVSRIFHAAFGEDHYPRFFAKWPDADLAALQAELQAFAARVGDARERNRAVRAHCDSLAAPAVDDAPGILAEGGGDGAEFSGRSAATGGLVGWGGREDALGTFMIESGRLDGIVSAPLLTALRAKGHRRLAALEEVLEEETPGVYTFQCLEPSFCRALLERADAFVEAQDEYQVKTQRDTDGGGENGVLEEIARHRHLQLDLFGLRTFLDALLRRLIKPLSEVLYAEVHGESLDWRYGYIIGYAAGKKSGVHNITRTSLRRHTDDSEVTLSVNLGREFTGGDVRFCGLRGTDEEEKEMAVISPELGQATIHRGAQLHEVLPVEEGERYMLIVWTRSSEYRAKTCACCVMNGRGHDCVTGTYWN